jgi:uncharacterized integral membrane protein (TIGR00697 family)
MDTGHERAVDASALPGQAFRYYDFVMAAFVAILLLSNVIGAGKVAQVTLPGIGPWPFGAGILFFPVSYVIGDVLTEVYGYARARRVIWAGTAAVVFMAFMSWVVVALPPAPSWGNQAAYAVIFGQVPRIVLASVLAFWAGEFVNSYVMARMKVWTGGKHLWTRLHAPAGRHRTVHAMGAEGGVGDRADAADLCRRGRAEAGRRRRRVRPGHGLHAIPRASLIDSRASQG